MKTVFIDTNFWLIPYIQKIDIFSELERILIEEYKTMISSGVINELKKIQESSKGKCRTGAKIALELIEKKVDKVIQNDSDVDELILKFSQNKENFIVCTNDKELRKKLRNKTKVIGMIGKSKLGFV